MARYVESMVQLSDKGIEVRFHQIRTIWPLLEDDLHDFVDRLERVFVVENNYSGQLASLIGRSLGDSSGKIESITKFDGSSFKPKEIAGAIIPEINTRVGA